MSGVEGYLADLREALGDRLPPAVHHARLREARGHLLASAQEVGEDEAVRRYGRARPVANGLVRTHRGYGERSAWALALPPGACLVTLEVALMTFGVLLVTRRFDLGLLPLARPFWTALILAVVLGFVARVVQTRRWLAGPMSGAHVLALLLTTIAARAWLPSPPARTEPSGFALLLRSVSLDAAIWFALNALALGTGSLLDRRRVWRAR